MFPRHFRPHNIADERRRALVVEALTWEGTPYRLTGQVRGAGVDCGTFLFCVLKNCGYISPDDKIVDRYRHDWFCHDTDERYERRLLKYATKIALSICTRGLNPQPATIALTRAVGSKVFNHGGIVIDWPYVIHACAPKVGVVDAMNDWLWQYRQIELFEVIR